MIDGNDKPTGTSTTEAKDQKTILVYGNVDCSHCVDFRDKLDSAGLEYTFYDVEQDQSKGEEMMLKVQRTGFQGYIRLPVVEVGGVIRVSPTFESVEKAL
jgi:glutaredoxin